MEISDILSIHKFFKYVDINDKGYLDEEALSGLVTILDPQMPGEEIKETVASMTSIMDRNGNGNVSEQEFTRWWVKKGCGYHGKGKLANIMISIRALDAMDASDDDEDYANEIKSKEAELTHNMKRLLHMDLKQIRDQRARAAFARARTRAPKEVPKYCEGHAFGLKSLGPENKYRQMIYSLVMDHRFDKTISAIILINCLFLVLENPSVDSDSDLGRVLAISDIIFAVLFAVEAMLKIIALG